ncbi:MAG: MBL fold metallo-hydrolase [Lachnospiraceae bacterium]|nr:MBL fold metallo-hydrolase [Lachnospiraceae bacterium]
MRIINLIEDTAGTGGCEFKHGLSFYIETDKHKILMDLGPSEVTVQNAVKLGVSLEKVDTVILSHGHYDHSGGILPFEQYNSKALIYLQSKADLEYYSDDGEDKGDKRYRYIGIDRKIMNLANVKPLEGDYRIDEELSLFTIKSRTHKLPSTNRPLKEKINGEYIPDDFAHEHYLVVEEKEKRLLISGCAHNGILSILDEFKQLYGEAPDMVISGFHLMKKSEYSDEELEEIVEISKCLMAYDTKFYTCHCTGLSAYRIMKEVMGDRLEYVHCGDEIV